MPNTARLKGMPHDAKLALALWRGKKNEVKIRKISPPEHKVAKYLLNLRKQSIQTDSKGRQKGLIARCVVKGDDHWVYYPRQENFSEFAAAHAAVRPNGPAELFPGSVGSMRVVEHGKSVEIKWLQSHFTSGVPQFGVLPRKLATEYGGWRKRIISELFKEMKKEGKPIELFTLHATPQTLDIFRQVAKEMGFALTDRKASELEWLVASPNKK